MGWEDIGKEDMKHLSASQIGMFQRCPMQYEFRYVKGIKKPPDSGLIVGISVHKGIEHNYRHKFEKKKAAPKDEVLDAFSQKFDESKDGAEIEDEGKSKDEGYNFVTMHYDKVAPTVHPTRPPELEFNINIPGVDRNFIGFIDVIGDVEDTNPYAEVRNVPGVIMDNKTTRRSFSQFEADVSLQLTSYAYADTQIGKLATGSVGLDILSKSKSGNIKPIRLLSNRSPEQLARFEHTIQTIEKTINAGLFYPTENPQHCSWCGYNEFCHAAAVKRKHESKLI